jgi:transposase InsO family protein
MVTSINQIWCADITYIRILNGFVYLAAIIDVYSRRIVGYALGKTLSPKLAIAALNMAIATRKTDNLIHHSDQGRKFPVKNILKY